MRSFILLLGLLVCLGGAGRARADGSPDGRTEVVRAEVVRVALSQVGVREHGFNRGQEVEMYQRGGGGKPGDAWCSWFVSWCLRQAHALTAYFGRARDWFDARHTVWTNGRQVASQPAPQPGDLVGYTWGADHICHVELLLLWGEGPSCKAIGGNTGGGRALLREGDGVFVNWRLKRNVKSVANPIDNPKY